MDEKDKKVDNDWKEKVAKEKTAEPQSDVTPDQEGGLPEQPDFSFFVSSLALQASIAMGVMPNPMTNKKEENIPQARLLVDTLAMLKEKTHGNLSSEEDSLLENLLYELRMQYVAKTKGGSS
ncbi:MAG TPA: DUF1844 domain-containing protein [Candidatus Omnitrophota bacterium]|nr:DUF1844 domain-containing protein [Candidatus Omnitrophota bacterium]HRZ14850.1 DUF1844 domain-containing protein [Candidatus Omnitrophota bacterium]